MVENWINDEEQTSAYNFTPVILRKLELAAMFSFKGTQEEDETMIATY